MGASSVDIRCRHHPAPFVTFSPPHPNFATFPVPDMVCVTDITYARTWIEQEAGAAAALSFPRRFRRSTADYRSTRGARCKIRVICGATQPAADPCRLSFKTRLFVFHDKTFRFVVSFARLKQRSQGAPLSTHILPLSISVFFGQNFRNPWPLARESAVVSS
jgi:hypothetical protein